MFKYIINNHKARMAEPATSKNREWESSIELILKWKNIKQVLIAP